MLICTFQFVKNKRHKKDIHFYPLCSLQPKATIVRLGFKGEDYGKEVDPNADNQRTRGSIKGNERWALIN